MIGAFGEKTRRQGMVAQRVFTEAAMRKTSWARFDPPVLILVAAKAAFSP
jgi:hypothetical protein